MKPAFWRKARLVGRACADQSFTLIFGVAVAFALGYGVGGALMATAIWLYMIVLTVAVDGAE